MVESYSHLDSGYTAARPASWLVYSCPSTSGVPLGQGQSRLRSMIPHALQTPNSNAGCSFPAEYYRARNLAGCFAWQDQGCNRVFGELLDLGLSYVARSSEGTHANHYMVWASCSR